MALDHDSYDFGGSALHGDIQAGKFDMAIVVRRWFGLQGESHLIDETKGRPLSCPYTLADFTQSALETQLQDIDDQQGSLTGTLTISGNIARTFPKCTFIGYDRDSMMFDAVSGEWWIEGTLHWIQRIKA